MTDLDASMNKKIKKALIALVALCIVATPIAVLACQHCKSSDNPTPNPDACEKGTATDVDCDGTVYECQGDEDTLSVCVNDGDQVFVTCYFYDDAGNLLCSYGDWYQPCTTGSQCPCS
jgi:hypothetical protein